MKAHVKACIECFRVDGVRLCEKLAVDYGLFFEISFGCKFIEIALSVYSACILHANASKIHGVQSLCLRFIYGIWNYQSWLFLHATCFLFKIIVFKKPPYLLSKIEYRREVKYRRLLSSPQYKLKMFKRGFTYFVPYYLNTFRSLRDSWQVWISSLRSNIYFFGFIMKAPNNKFTFCHMVSPMQCNAIHFYLFFRNLIFF